MKKRIGVYWEKIINIGTSDSNPFLENKKVRLVNSLCLIGIISLILWAITYAFDGIGITSLEAIVPAGILALVIFVNHLKLYSFGRYFHYIGTVLIFTYYAIAHGEKDGAEYFLLITCIIGLMYFNNLVTLSILFVFNMACFWVAKYTYTIMDPPVLSGHTLYIPNLISTFVVLFLIAYYFKRENAYQEQLLFEKNQFLAAEKEKSENLLLNILPKKVADELKATGTNVPQYFEMATVIFTDFKEFTRISQTMTPAELVEEINEYFTAFDQIVKKYNIEKIKTIGDAYLCVGGLPHINNTNPTDAVMAALEFQEYVRERKAKREKQDLPFFDLRIGIHTGPVVAGVVGASKFAYDIWGDTVNTASRLESTCEEGKINISQYTYEHIKDQFLVEHRGKIEAKYKGMIDMYYVLGRTG